MMYDIAGEYVEYDTQKTEIRKRFENYLVDNNRCSDGIIHIDLAELEAYREAHGYLPEIQCELIFSLQQFFAGLRQKKKLLIHASAVGINGLCYIFIGQANAGKSTISQHFASYSTNACVLSDDRTVIGLVDGILHAWGTPWSKIDSKPRTAVPVQSVIYIEQAAKNKVEEISVDKMQVYCANMYPSHLGADIGTILNLLLFDTRLYLLRNGMSYYDPEALYRVLSQ